MKKTLLLIIILLTGCVSLLAQPVSQREKEEIFTRTKKLFGDAYYFSQTAISTIAFLDKQWKAGKYKPFTTVDDFLAALGADLKNTARDNHLNFFMYLHWRPQIKPVNNRLYPGFSSMISFRIMV